MGKIVRATLNENGETVIEYLGSYIPPNYAKECSGKLDGIATLLERIRKELEYTRLTK